MVHVAAWVASPGEVEAAPEAWGWMVVMVGLCICTLRERGQKAVARAP